MLIKLHLTLLLLGLLAVANLCFAQENVKPHFNANATEVTIHGIVYPVSMLDSGTIKFLHDKINNEADLLNNKGVKAFYTKDYSQALRMFKKAIEVRPDFKEAMFNTAAVKVAQEKYEDALKVYDQLLLLESSPEIWYFKGAMALKLERYEQAIKFFSRAAKEDVKFTKAHYEVGATYMKQSKWGEAVKAFTKAIELDDKKAEFYFGRGMAMFKQTEYRDAITDFDKAVKLNNKLDMAFTHRGMAKFELHEYTNAIADFDDALKVNPNNLVALINRAATKHQVKNYGEALADCNKALEIDPKNGLAYLNRGIVKVILGDSVGACNDLKKAKTYGAEKVQELMDKHCN